MNNYWDTNFWASQPGHIQFKYELNPFDKFEPLEAHKVGVAAADPVEMNAVITCSKEESGQLLDGKGKEVVPLHVKPAEDNSGIVIMLRNLSNQTSDYDFTIPGKDIISASIVNTLEEAVGEAELLEGKVQDRKSVV